MKISPINNIVYQSITKFLDKGINQLDHFYDYDNIEYFIGKVYSKEDEESNLIKFGFNCKCFD